VCIKNVLKNSLTYSFLPGGIALALALHWPHIAGKCASIVFYNFFLTYSFCPHCIRLALHHRLIVVFVCSPAHQRCQKYSHIIVLPRVVLHWHLPGLCFFCKVRGLIVICLFLFSHPACHDAWSTGCLLFELCFTPGLFVVSIVFFCPSLLAKVNLLLFVSTIVRG